MDDTSAATAESQSWKQPLMPGAWWTRVVSGEGGGNDGSLEGVEVEVVMSVSLLAGGSLMGWVER